jgi:hypothetical protein
VKYETPQGQRPAIDVPPRAANWIADPARPLYVTESVMKADALVSAGVAAIGLNGVYGWRGTNSRGGKTVLPDWESIALNGRDVYLVPDSDVAENADVNAAVRRLGAWLAARDANVRYVTLPYLNGGSKTGVDDYFATMGYPEGLEGMRWLASDEPPRPGPSAPSAPPTPEVPVPADPAALLHELLAWLESYVTFPSPHNAVALALWIVHTHLAHRFDATGRLVLLSPEPECGKTRVMELAALTCAGAEMLSGVSPAYLFRRIGTEGQGPVTLLLDEADTIWGRKGDDSAEAIRSIINAGHRKGATVGRVDMNNGRGEVKLVRYAVYAPAALAAKGDPLPDTIMSRALVIHMRRRAPGQEVRRYRERITRPEGEELQGKLAAWAASVEGKVGDPWPELPGGLDDRPADVWEPLFTVADLAGGDWPALAGEACAGMIKGAREDAQSAGIRLLADLRTVFGDAGELPTEAVLAKLHELPEAPWGDWYGHPLTARELAKLLRPYEVRPQVVRIGDKTPRGYKREELAAPWASYVPPPRPVSATSATSATPLISHVALVADVALTPEGGANLWTDDEEGEPPF